LRSLGRGGQSSGLHHLSYSNPAAANFQRGRICDVVPAVDFHRADLRRDPGGGNSMDVPAEATERRIVPGLVAARRAAFVTVPARPEKQAIWPGLGRHLSTTPSPARH
jgi:hypothetical protein